MLRLTRLLPFRPSQTRPLNLADRPLPYSWILSNRLAVGPMPRTDRHWQQLAEAGFRSRFSCCYPQEEVFSPVPASWLSESISLPDHRNQEELQASVLKDALLVAEGLLTTNAPLFLHCFAGRERSSLMAVGLAARSRDMDVFTALDWVRRCHPMATPIYEHLSILEQVLATLP